MRISQPLSHTLAPILLILAGLGIATYGVWTMPVPQMYAFIGFGLLFSSGAAWSLWRSRRRRRQAEETQRELEKRGDAPWTVRPEWRSDEIRSQPTMNRSFAVLTVVWNVISWGIPAALLTAGELDLSAGGAWLMALFPIIGLGLAAKLGVDWGRTKKYGISTLRLHRMPARLGDPLRATLRTGVRQGEGPADGFRVMVSCYRQFVTYSRDSDGDRKKEIRRDLLWRDETQPSGRPYGDGTKLEVPISVDLPTDLPPSTPLKTDNRIVWEVSTRASVKGLDFTAEVEIPVFPSKTPDVPLGDGEGLKKPAGDDAEAPLDARKPAKSSSEIQRDKDAAQSSPERLRTFDAPVTSSIVLDASPGAFALEFRPRWNQSGVWIMGGIGIAMSGGGVLMFAVSVLFGLLFLGAGGLLLYGTVQKLTNRTVVRIADGTIAVTHSGIGMPADVTFPAGDLVDAEVQLQSGTPSSTQYGLFLLASEDAGLDHLKEQAARSKKFISKLGAPSSVTDTLDPGTRQPRVLVSQDLTHKAEAEWLARQIQEAARRERAFD